MFCFLGGIRLSRSGRTSVQVLSGLRKLHLRRVRDGEVLRHDRAQHRSGGAGRRRLRVASAAALVHQRPALHARAAGALSAATGRRRRSLRRVFLVETSLSRPQFDGHQSAGVLRSVRRSARAERAAQDRRRRPSLVHRRQPLPSSSSVLKSFNSQ